MYRRGGAAVAGSGLKRGIGGLLGTLECDDASVGFRLADPYRAQASARLHTAKLESEKRFEAVEALSDGDLWVCRGCKTNDLTMLVEDEDGAGQVCLKCGTVDASLMLIQRNRQKACEEREDKTVVADAPQAESTQAPHSNFFETANAARARKLKKLSGGSCGAALLQSTHARVTRALLHGEPGDEDAGVASLGERKTRSVGTSVELVLQTHLKNMHVTLQRHVRKTVSRIVSFGVQHGECCTANCPLMLLSRPNALLATSIVKFCLEEALEKSPESLGSEVRKEDLQENLKIATTLTVPGSTNTVKHQVEATVRVIAKWPDVEAACKPCIGGPEQPTPTATNHPNAPHAPPPLLLPPPALMTTSSSSSLGSTSDPDTPSPNGNVWQVRDSLYATQRLTNQSLEQLTKSLAAIRNARIMEYLQSNGYSPDLSALIVFRAVEDEATETAALKELIASTTVRAQLSVSTVSNATGVVRLMLKEQPMASEDDALF